MARLRVAAYCRVSTDQDDQLHSLAAQKQFFQAYIDAHPTWTLAGIWADEGVSGTRPESGCSSARCSRRPSGASLTLS